jgi:hypothetical protein
MCATKRWSRVLVALGVVTACIAFAAFPAAAAAQQPGAGSATGSGTDEFGDVFSFTATGGPAAATGTMTYTGSSFGGPFTTHVECIGVFGNRALIVGGQIFDIQRLIFSVQDNGIPGAGVDRFRGTVGFGNPASFCGDLTWFDVLDPGGPIRSGEIVVRGPGADCPPNDDKDGDGLTDENESLFFTLLGNSDSDLDGIPDGNDDANGNGEDDEDEDDDDDEDDGCPDDDSDGDGVDDEDEDD